LSGDVAEEFHNSRFGARFISRSAHCEEVTASFAEPRPVRLGQPEYERNDDRRHGFGESFSDVTVSLIDQRIE